MEEREKERLKRLVLRRFPKAVSDDADVKLCGAECSPCTFQDFEFKGGVNSFWEERGQHLVDNFY